MVIKNIVGSCLLLILVSNAHADENKAAMSDRQYWVNLAYQLSEPVLKNMAENALVKRMPVELSPTWDGRRKDVVYMEAFGRLMAGLAPWLALPDDKTNEGRKRKRLRQWALQSYVHAVDPESNDYFLWDKEGQVLVDAAYIANSFLRAPEALWDPLDALTKQRYIERFKSLRRVDPPYTNWLMFSAMIEAFLLSIDEDYDAFRIHMAIRKVEEWYVGDGLYADGEQFALDYYNSYVIQPMFVEVLQVLVENKIIVDEATLTMAQNRMKRYAIFLERLISPEGSYPVFGRSITYRMAAFQPLSLLALKDQLPQVLSEGQIRAALTAVMKRMFSRSDNTDQNGFLRLGFVGHQPDLADWYTNNGSLYMTSLVFLPLGLPEKHFFWQAVAEDWTSKKAWSGNLFPRDDAISF